MLKKKLGLLIKEPNPRTNGKATKKKLNDKGVPIWFVLQQGRDNAALAAWSAYLKHRKSVEGRNAARMIINGVIAKHEESTAKAVGEKYHVKGLRKITNVSSEEKSKPTSKKTLNQRITSQERFYLPNHVPRGAIINYLILRTVLADDLKSRKLADPNWRTKFLNEYALSDTLRTAIPKDWLHLTDEQLFKKLSSHKRMIEDSKLI